MSGPERIKTRLRERKDVRTRPKRQKTYSKEEVSCPTCGLSIKLNDVNSHLQVEIDKLYKIPQRRPVSRRPNPDLVYSSNVDSTLPAAASSNSESNNSTAFPSQFSDENAHSNDQVCELNISDESSSRLNGSCSSKEQDSDSRRSNNEILSTSAACSSNAVTTGQSSGDGQSTGYTGEEPPTNNYMPESSPQEYNTAVLRPTRRLSKEQIEQQNEGTKVVRSIRSNRFTRLQEQRQRLSGLEERTCPQCYKILQTEDFPLHVDQCLESGDDGTDSDEDGEGSFPQYEWCGQTRVRVTDLLRSQGQLRSLGTLVESGPEDDEVDVCNDADFGPQQFFESDVIEANLDEDSDMTTSNENESASPTSQTTLPGCSHQCDELIYEAQDPNKPRSTPDTLVFSDANFADIHQRPHCNGSVPGNNVEYASLLPSSSNSNRSALMNSAVDTTTDASSKVSATSSSPLESVVETLLKKVKFLELQAVETRSFVVKCSVCRDRYEEPLVSTVCWHVHCRQCWMSTIVNKRQCPQCLAIFSVSDLRKVFL